jgi:adenylate cyclase
MTIYREWKWGRRPLKRKIAAILAADLVGYSRLMAEDEEETMRRLMSYRAVFDDFITKAEGRIFNTAGDAVLAEFPSAVDAVRAAIDIQESLRTRNMSYPPSRHMVFRIGLTIGDVIQREGDLLGDGVNVAARLQGLASPGGICVSRSVHEQVADKLSVVFNDLGPQDVKNIPRPIYAYQVELEKGALPQALAGKAKTQADAPKLRPSASLVLIAVLAIALSALGSFVVLDKLWPPQGTSKKEVATAVPTPSASNPTAANRPVKSKELAPSPSSVVQSVVDPSGSFTKALSDVMSSATPDVAEKERREIIARFMESKLHRGIAVQDQYRKYFISESHENVASAVEETLEGCQLRYAKECAIVAADDKASPDTLVYKDMPRLKYSGVFDLSKIPAVPMSMRLRKDVQAYFSAPAAKAMAIHPLGILFVSVGEQSLRNATTTALRLCNGDTIRGDAEGPCYLYAISNDVVLPERLKSPL